MAEVDVGLIPLGAVLSALGYILQQQMWLVWLQDALRHCEGE